MAILSLKLVIFLTISHSTFATFDLTSSAATISAPQQSLFFTISPLPQPPHDHTEHVILSHHASLLAPILSHLGFNELATAAPSLFSDSSTVATWSGPYTIFAPSDSSVRSCISCSTPSLLREHMVPGLFTNDYLRKLTFEQMTSITFPFGHHDRSIHNNQFKPQQTVALMRFMLRDAMLRLRNNGFSVLSLAMKIKYPDLIPLVNVTIFSLDDVSIFSGSYSYIHSVRFPCRAKPVFDCCGSGETSSGDHATDVGQRAEFGGDDVHSIYLSFPHLHSVTAVTDGTLGGDQRSTVVGTQGGCEATNEQGGCGLSKVNHVATQLNPHPNLLEFEDRHHDHGL
ncbi:hypothetical protein F3Y22_tig00112079pilonHSYRG00012 [Hibiscus syriacus]|uniref:FAS1 domain-containing protein n=1 Tax=Hibiscus syriacus TaxID=106335 RepID=A0A6A2YCL2_HIBSY|nr:hypothetical protein F3Y22_tig00112079pilonHSYRG00012 [Hibiscus syriacus]